MPEREYTDVERPFIRQLQGMGWKYVGGFVEAAAATGRNGVPIRTLQ